MKNFQLCKEQREPATLVVDVPLRALESTGGYQTSPWAITFVLWYQTHAAALPGIKIWKGTLIFTQNSCGCLWKKKSFPCKTVRLYFTCTTLVQTITEEDSGGIQSMLTLKSTRVINSALPPYDWSDGDLVCLWWKWGLCMERALQYIAAADSSQGETRMSRWENEGRSWEADWNII